MDYLAVCTEFVERAGSVSCNGQFSVIPVDQLITRFELEQLNPEIIAQMFAAGFGLVGSFYALGMGVRAVLNTIKRG